MQHLPLAEVHQRGRQVCRIIDGFSLPPTLLLSCCFGTAMNLSTASIKGGGLSQSGQASSFRTLLPVFGCSHTVPFVCPTGQTFHAAGMDLCQPMCLLLRTGCYPKRLVGSGSRFWLLCTITKCNRNKGPVVIRHSQSGKRTAHGRLVTGAGKCGNPAGGKPQVSRFKDSIFCRSGAVRHGIAVTVPIGNYKKGRRVIKKKEYASSFALFTLGKNGGCCSVSLNALK